MDSSDEEEDFPTADLDDLVWSEESIPNSQQHLYKHQILHHTPRPATPSPTNTTKEYSLQLEQMDTEILDDLPDIINVPKALLSDLTLGHTVCSNTKGNMTFKSGQ